MVFNMPDIYKSYAKLNLNLHVKALAPNNLHPISSVFQEIDLYDTLTITTSPSQTAALILSSSGIEMPTDSTNILFKVFNNLMPQLTRTYNVHVDKKIPLGSGMGGSSSNAATFLKAINTIEALNLTDNELIKFSEKIGSDVAFFISGKKQHVSEFGNILSPIASTAEKSYYTIIYPNIHCSTKDIYNHFDYMLEKNLFHNTTKAFQKNNLFEVALNLYPEINDIYLKLKSFSPKQIYLTGSGSTFYITHNTKQHAQEFTTKLKEIFPSLYIKLVSDVLAD